MTRRGRPSRRAAGRLAEREAIAARSPAQAPSGPSVPPERPPSTDLRRELAAALASVEELRADLDDAEETIDVLRQPLLSRRE